MSEMQKIAIFVAIGGVCGVDARGADYAVANQVLAEVDLKSADASGIYTRDGLLTAQHYKMLLERGEAVVFQRVPLMRVPAMIYNLIGQAVAVSERLWDEQRERYMKPLAQQLPQAQMRFYQSASISGLVRGQIYGKKVAADGSEVSAIEECWLMVTEALGRFYVMPLVAQENWKGNVYEPILPKEGRRSGPMAFRFQMPLAYFLARQAQFDAEMPLREKLIQMGTTLTEEHYEILYHIGITEQERLVLVRGAYCCMMTTPLGVNCNGLFTNDLQRISKFHLDGMNDPQGGGTIVTSEGQEVRFSLIGERLGLCLTIVLGGPKAHIPSVAKIDICASWQTQLDQATGEMCLATRLSEQLLLVRTSRGDRIERID